MNDNAPTNARLRVEEALEQLDRLLQSGSSFPPGRHEDALSSALTRARRQLLDPSEDLLKIALVGGTGAGKSTIINALAGEAIAEVGAQRPCTSHPTIYLPAGAPMPPIDDDLLARATRVEHSRTELARRVIIDTPDLDSLAREHRTTTQRVLKSVGLILFVVTQQKYLDDSGWSVIREEQTFAPCAVVLNRIDEIGSTQDVDEISQDITRRFADLGRPGVRVFRIVARDHAPGTATDRPVRNLPDDWAALVRFIESEIDTSELLRMRRRTQQHIARNLCALVDAVVPPDTAERLRVVRASLAGHAQEIASQLTDSWRVVIDQIERSCLQNQTLRDHQLFSGPLRAWIGICDALFVALPAALRSPFRFASPARPESESMSMGFVHLDALDPDVARRAITPITERIQTELYEQQMPIEPWRSKARARLKRDLRPLIAKSISSLDANSAPRIRRGMARAISWIATTLTALLVIYTFVRLAWDLFAGSYTGERLFLQSASVFVLLMVLLQFVVTLITRRRGSTEGIAVRAVEQAITKHLQSAFDDYAQPLLRDAQATRLAVDQLRTVVFPDGVEPTPEPAIDFPSSPPGPSLEPRASSVDIAPGTSALRPDTTETRSAPSSEDDDPARLAALLRERMQR